MSKDGHVICYVSGRQAKQHATCGHGVPFSGFWTWFPRSKMAAVGPGPVSTPDNIPGADTATSTSILETGTGMLQNFAPINNIHAYLCAFHMYAYDMSRQVEAHHYCGHLNEEVRQCVIYDGFRERIIGIEYIISERLFLGLPEEEKQLWHSHEFEVKGGILFMPGVPKFAEHAEMAKLVKTYGKTFHFWQFDRGDTLPMGLPQLMMSFTSEGQLDQQLAENTQKRFDVSFEENKQNRADLKGLEHGIHPRADPWMKGKGLVTILKESGC